LKILKKEMKLKGLSPAGLSEKIGASKQTIYYWIYGVCLPAAKFAKALKDLGFSDAACLEPSRDVTVEEFDNKQQP